MGPDPEAPSIPPAAVDVEVPTEQDMIVTLSFERREVSEEADRANWWELSDTPSSSSSLYEIVSADQLRLEVQEAQNGLLQLILDARLEVPGKRRRLPNVAITAARGIIENFFVYEWGNVERRAGGAAGLLALISKIRGYEFVANLDAFDNIKTLLYSFYFRIRDIDRDLNRYKATYRRKDDLPDPSRYASDPVNRDKVNAALRTPRELRDLFDKAAEAQELNRTDWILMHLGEALRREGFDPGELIPPRGRGSKPIDAELIDPPTKREPK